MPQWKVKYISCKTEEGGEVCFSNSRSREQRSRSHLCDSGDWITRPLHQECNQKHSNTPPDIPPQTVKKLMLQVAKTSISCSQLSSMLGFTQHGPLHYSCSSLELVLFCLCILICLFAFLSSICLAVVCYFILAKSLYHTSVCHSLYWVILSPDYMCMHCLMYFSKKGAKQDFQSAN